MPVGKILIIVGAVLIIIGAAINYSDRIPFIGKLPGDLVIEQGKTKIFIPIATSILLSILLSLILYFINRFKN